MKKLESYIAGEWFAPASSGIVLHHAINGSAVAEISSAGIDFQDMLDHARDIGGPELRHFTFHQRALMLKELGKYLMERKELFYECSEATGATRTDSWIDIEGGIGTLFTYSGKGRREMPNSHLYIDGDQQQISRSGTFTAQHVMSALQGVAVHINAFNFPCWGMLEKLAPTLLAGMPAIVKPASQTAFLTELMFRHIIESGILPPGAVQLICGSTGDLLDRLDFQDAVSFTGSSKTGLKLKQTPAIIKSATRFFMEADSLNCSILGTDVEPGSAEFDLYIKEVLREMTTKAGQKCTAIRRAIVPENRIDDVAEALSKKLQQLTIGNPANEKVRMGALASMAQRDDVLTHIEQLTQDNLVLFGQDIDIAPIDADNETGAFLSPILLQAEDPQNSSAHEIEAFGPVSTLIAYQDIEQAIELAALGKGSLVSSIISNDENTVQRLAFGCAPFHGRILVLNAACAKESTGHGSPLPQLIHGGPGHAGGSEEMGGILGVKHYMQRTALQGSPDMLTAITGQWMTGSQRKTDDKHPFEKTFGELEIGDSIVTDKREIKLEDIEKFAELSGDHFYAHMDEAAAKRNPFFDDRVAHGYFLVSLAAGLFVWPDEGPVLANYGLDNLRFSAPVYAGDVLQVQFTCKHKSNREGEDYGEVRWDTTIINQNDEVVANYDVLTLVAE
jgi:oxepin-CoA hydrolase/3-oxo-5,6-dehydrosuberyl-CoA semialdehyde dehydrogenase